MRMLSGCLPIALVAAGLAIPGGADAGSVAVTTKAGQAVKVEAEDASIDEIMARLGATYGFAIDRRGSSDAAPLVSGHYEGTLRQVLARLLGNENHMIQHSSVAKQGIARIVLYGTGKPESVIPGQASVAQAQQVQGAMPRPQPISRALPQATAGVPAAAARPQPIAPQLAVAQPAARVSQPQPVPAGANRRRGGAI